MSKPIISIWMAKPLPGVSALPQAEQDRLMGQIDQELKNTGGRRIADCRCEWSSERWLYFGAEEYPDAQSLMKYKRKLADMGWYNYLDSRILLGTALDPVELATAGSGGVFKLWFVNPTPAYNQLDEQKLAAIYEQHNAGFTRAGGKSLIFASSFSSERYTHFGLEYFPDLDAVRAFSDHLAEIKWHQYFDGDILLGTQWG